LDEALGALGRHPISDDRLRLLGMAESLRRLDGGVVALQISRAVIS
jgi:hypothetical protein